jgi:hypothetical protein
MDPEPPVVPVIPDAPVAPARSAAREVIRETKSEACMQGPEEPEPSEPMDSWPPLKSVSHSTRTGRAKVKKPVSVAVRRRPTPEPENDFVVVEMEKVERSRRKKSRPVSDSGENGNGDDGGSMMRGVLISSLCALAGAAVWFALARFTGQELSPIAWLVGLAAGCGMLLGLHHTSRAAGATSAALAIGGILLGKVLVFFFVTLPLLGLLALISQEQLRQTGIDPAHATTAQYQVARDKAGRILRDMDFATREAAIEKGQESIRSAGSPMAYMTTSERGIFMLRNTFHWMDLLYVALAVGTAFKIATYSSGKNGD